MTQDDETTRSAREPRTPVDLWPSTDPPPPTPVGVVGVDDEVDETAAPPPGFAPGSPRAGAGPTMTIPTTSRFPGDDLDDQALDGDDDDDWFGPPGDRATSTRGALGAARTVAPFLVELVQAAGVAANERALDHDRHPDQWLTDANDELIADPLARIAARYMPAGLVADPTLRDALEAALILGRYALKQLNLAIRWRRQRRGGEVGAQPAAAASMRPVEGVP